MTRHPEPLHLCTAREGRTPPGIGTITRHEGLHIMSSIARKSIATVFAGAVSRRRRRLARERRAVQIQDGLVNVAIGDVTILEDVNVGVAAQVAANVCGVKVGPVAVLGRAVDRSGADADRLHHEQGGRRSRARTSETRRRSPPVLRRPGPRPGAMTRLPAEGCSASGVQRWSRKLRWAMSKVARTSRKNSDAAVATSADLGRAPSRAGPRAGSRGGSGPARAC